MYSVEISRLASILFYITFFSDFAQSNSQGGGGAGGGETHTPDGLLTGSR